MSYPENAVSNPYYETIELSQNTTGIFVDVPRIGNYMLIEAKDIDSTRKVRYISIYIAGYSSSTPCDTMRVHDIEMTYYSPDVAEDWWLDEFPFRKYHAINGSTGAGIDYVIPIIVHSGTGTDSGNLVNLPSNHWTTSDPVRFTRSDGIAVLDYWKEKVSGNDAYYWVKIRDNLNDDVGIYLYYGNSSAPSLSEGESSLN